MKALLLWIYQQKEMYYNYPVRIAITKRWIMSFFLTEDVFSQSDMAKTLAEITKIDPSFNKDNFLHECEYEIIPTVLQVSLLAIS